MMEIGEDGLWIGDPCSIPEIDDGLVVALPAGIYAVESKFVSIDDVPLIVCARCAPSPGVGATLGAIIGETRTDVALTGMVDFRRVLEFFDLPITDEEARNLCEPDVASLVTLMRPGTTLQVSVVSSGCADGDYPVFEILDQGHRIGIEVRFVEDGADLVPDD